MRRFLGTQLILAHLSAVAVGQSVPSSIGGSWKVMRWSAPGISGMRDGEASSWIGRIARFEDKLVEFGLERCEAPTYASSTADSEKYFIEGFRISA